MAKAWGMWKYRYRYFDEDLIRGRFNNVLHSIVKIENEQPIMAAASFFATAPYIWGRSFSGVVLNIIPTNETETAVVVSYAKEHSSDVRKFFAPIKLERDPVRQKLLLCQLIVNRMENFFMKPSIVDAWGDEKRVFIESAYETSVKLGQEVPLDDRLMLFP